MNAFDIMWSIRKSMDFPQVPIEESHANSEGLRILLHACNHVMDSNDEVWHVINFRVRKGKAQFQAFRKDE